MIVSGAAGGQQQRYSELLLAAACGSGGSCAVCRVGSNGDGCRWRQPVSQWKLQVNSSSGISFQWSYAVTAAAIFGEFDLVLRVAVVALAQRHNTLRKEQR